MTQPPRSQKPGALGFRGKLIAAMMLVVFTVTALALFITQRRAESGTQARLQAQFQGKFEDLLRLEKARLAAITGRCRALARSVRIRAALEENDVPDLYANAAIELRDVLEDKARLDPDDPSPRARFFRFLDGSGAVMPLEGVAGVEPPTTWEKQLAMTPLSAEQEVGYVEVPGKDGQPVVSEIIATPIIATDSGEVLGAIVLGFAAGEFDAPPAGAPFQSGLWLAGRLRIPSFPEQSLATLSGAVGGAEDPAQRGRLVEAGGEPWLMFSRVLNPGSRFPPASQVCLYPLAESLAAQQQLRWQIVEAGAVVLLCGLLVSHFVAGRLSKPVARLEEDSEENRTQRERAEVALEISNRELRVRNEELQAALTDLKAAQSHVVQQERLRALGEMASGIAHDFNNALVPVLGFCELLLLSPRVLDDKVKAKRYLETIQTAAKDAASVVGRLREFYRPDKSDRDFAPVSLKRIAEQAITLTRPRWKDQAQAAGATVQIVLELEPVPNVSGEESALREVLTNLIFNAVDAMPQGGTITLRTRCTGDCAVLEVADTGSGMTEEVRKRCLDPFFSTKGERGTGLGLSMVFGIIQRHSGSLELRSELGVGTTFIITLPLQESSAPSAVAKAAARAIPSLRVLVVDDEAPIRDTLAAILTADGHDVSLAHDGAAGLRQFTEGRFDLVLSDKAMPGMSGDQMATAIKRLSPKTPIVLLTGFGLFHDKSEFPDVDVLASKPIRIPILRDAIASALQLV